MATKQIAWQTGNGNITLTYQGQGDDPINVVSDANNGSARSQTITIQTTKGGLVTKNVTVSQAACPIPVGTVLNYNYTGDYQEVTLPAGRYKLQLWGAQGGSNAAASSYGITAQAGGKGGYSEGIITLSQITTFRVYVGGQGSSSAGGFNGGGSTSGSASYNSGNEQGVSRMGGGGGATDIRLSDGALLSRIIVAGGGGGGAMCYSEVTTTVDVETQKESVVNEVYQSGGYYMAGYKAQRKNITPGKRTIIRFTDSQSVIGAISYIDVMKVSSSGTTVSETIVQNAQEFIVPEGGTYSYITAIVVFSSNPGVSAVNYKINEITSESSISTFNSAQVGFVGGGTNGDGYSSTYQGKQNAAGNGGSFGQGANQSTTNYRYCSGAGGGGWYGGGGGKYSDGDMDTCKQSGGGSGFVNTAASAGNRPSGYTGLQLDSGETKAGNTSFPAPGGGNETGHAGNGCARITRLN